jgi:pyrimidine operon attenuation protein/uracil phosphoribosyltransferase
MAQIREKAQLMSASEIDRTLVRLAHEVLEGTEDLDKLALIGIRRGGVPLAERLARKIGELENRVIPVGSVDIQHYRDDQTAVGQHPVINSADIRFPLNGLDVVLVDDVLQTGRTVLVLIDRGHRELPIEARYVGRTVPTASNENIVVKFQELDGMEQVILSEAA